VRQDQANFRNGRAYAPDGYYTNIVRYLDNSFLADKNDPRDFSFYPEYRDLKFEPLVANLMPQETPARQTSLKRAVEIYNAFLARSEMGHEDWVTIGAPPNERPTEVAMKQSREALVEASKILESDLLTIFLQWSGFPGD
jgi:hypothetical protein